MDGYVFGILFQMREAPALRAIRHTYSQMFVRETTTNVTSTRGTKRKAAVQRFETRRHVGGRPIRSTRLYRCGCDENLDLSCEPVPYRSALVLPYPGSIELALTRALRGAIFLAYLLLN